MRFIARRRRQRGTGGKRAEESAIHTALHLAVAAVTGEKLHGTPVAAADPIACISMYATAFGCYCEPALRSCGHAFHGVYTALIMTCRIQVMPSTAPSPLRPPALRCARAFIACRPAWSSHRCTAQHACATLQMLGVVAFAAHEASGRVVLVHRPLYCHKTWLSDGGQLSRIPDPSSPCGACMKWETHMPYTCCSTGIHTLSMFPRPFPCWHCRQVAIPCVTSHASRCPKP